MVKWFRIKIVRRANHLGCDCLLFGAAVKFFVVWTGQAVWVWVTLLPVLILNATERNPGFRWSDIVGAIIWGLGFACELTADLQKQQWRKDPANKGRFINVGGSTSLLSVNAAAQPFARSVLLQRSRVAYMQQRCCCTLMKVAGTQSSVNLTGWAEDLSCECPIALATSACGNPTLVV